MTRRLVAALALLVATGTACGTRVRETDAAEASGRSAASVSGDQVQDHVAIPAETPAGVVGSQAVPSATDAGTERPAPPSAAPRVVAPGLAPTAVGRSAAEVPRSNRASDSVAPAPAPEGQLSGVDNPGGPRLSHPPASGARSPVVVATVGTLSGPAASTLIPVVDGAQVWAKSASARRALNGHPVKLIVFDDAGDPARHRSQVQEAVERHRVIAFVANPESITGAGSVDYLNQKRVPVVGTNGGTPWAYASPMYFPQASDGDAMGGIFLPSVVDQAPGRRRIAVAYCAEAVACGQISRMMRSQAKSLGVEIVYETKSSIAQPDFTAECLAARNADAEVFVIVLDSNSVGRLASSCARQAYRPRFATATNIILDRFKDDPNLIGLIGASQVFPYFQTGTAAADEYQRALQTFGAGVGNGVGQAAGWTAGKLLERAGAQMTEPPSTESLLAGLWSLKDESLGGLTYPLTFVRDRPVAPRSCWFNMTLGQGGWSSPDEFRLRCGPPGAMSPVPTDD